MELGQEEFEGFDWNLLKVRIGFLVGRCLGMEEGTNRHESEIDKGRDKVDFFHWGASDRGLGAVGSAI